MSLDHGQTTFNFTQVSSDYVASTSTCTAHIRIEAEAESFHCINGWALFECEGTKMWTGRGSSITGWYRNIRTSLTRNPGSNHALPQHGSWVCFCVRGDEKQDGSGMKKAKSGAAKPLCNWSSMFKCPRRSTVGRVADKEGREGNSISSKSWRAGWSCIEKCVVSSTKYCFSLRFSHPRVLETMGCI